MRVADGAREVRLVGQPHTRGEVPRRRQVAKRLLDRVVRAEQAMRGVLSTLECPVMLGGDEWSSADDDAAEDGSTALTHA